MRAGNTTYCILKKDALKTQYIVSQKQKRKNSKKTKKSVDIPGFPWYYIQALERDGKKQRAERLGVRGRQERTGP